MLKRGGGTVKVVEWNKFCAAVFYDMRQYLICCAEEQLLYLLMQNLLFASRSPMTLIFSGVSYLQ